MVVREPLLQLLERADGIFYAVHMFTKRVGPIGLVAVLMLGACGASDDTGKTDGDDLPAGSASIEVGDSGADPIEPASGAGTGMLTMADGTVYTFEMSTCDTSVNKPDTFVVDPGYELFGKTSDGFRLQLIRAAFEEPTNGGGDLEGQFDEGGGNPKVSYLFKEPESTITLDGDTVTGDLVMSGVYSTDQIHGETTTATLTVTC